MKSSKLLNDPFTKICQSFSEPTPQVVPYFVNSPIYSPEFPQMSPQLENKLQRFPKFIRQKMYENLNPKMLVPSPVIFLLVFFSTFFSPVFLNIFSGFTRTKSLENFTNTFLKLFFVNFYFNYSLEFPQNCLLGH